jgi:DNA-binding NarL/FixJ family response regulator
MSSANSGGNKSNLITRDSGKGPTRQLGAGSAAVRSKPIRVLVVDDQLLVLAGICELVKLLTDVEVVAQAKNGREALRLMEIYSPEIILMDVAMPEMTGLEATILAKKSFPHTKIILLSEHWDEQLVTRALRSGAEAIVLKNAPVEELHATIKAVAHGSYRLPQISEKDSPDKPDNLRAETELIRITGRQREVLQLIGEGKSTKEIATLLRISVNTVKTHRMKLMEKLGVHEVTGVVRYAVKIGLVYKLGFVLALVLQQTHPSS